MARTHVPRRGPDARGGGLQRRGRDGLDAHDASARSASSPTTSRCSACSSRPSCGCTGARADIVRFAQGEGYIQVADDKSLVLVEEAIRPDDLDTADLREKLAAPRPSVAAAEHGTEEERRALRDKRRWEAFQRIASGD